MPGEINSQSNSVPHTSEHFGNIPNASEEFGKIRNSSEAFRNFPKTTEKKDYCTLTVRETARLFESAGVARTERSITNWCQPNRIGVSRLDNYFDPNERKYFISPQSVELAIQEEKAKAVKSPSEREPSGDVRNISETPATSSRVDSEHGASQVGELQKQVFDLQITNRGKDYLIEQLQRERDGFFGQLLEASRKVGELETKLQLEGPKTLHEVTDEPV